MFCVFPFCLSTACYVFTKLLRPLVRRWRSRGLRCIVYIDDGNYAAESRDQCVEGTKMIIDDLTSAGFIVSVSTSKLTPQQVGQWLGFTLDLNGKFFVPKEKITKLVHSVNSALAAELVPAWLVDRGTKVAKLNLTIFWVEYYCELCVKATSWSQHLKNLTDKRYLGPMWPNPFLKSESFSLQSGQVLFYPETLPGIIVASHCLNHKTLPGINVAKLLLNLKKNHLGPKWPSNFFNLKAT